VIDDAGGSFSFPRLAMMVQAGAPVAIAPAAAMGESPASGPVKP